MFGLDPCLGRNGPPQHRVLAACKSETAAPIRCAAGIGMRANPECFIILLSSNPISISSHSINRIKMWLKVITQMTCPLGVSPVCADTAIPAQPSASLLQAPKAFTLAEFRVGSSCRRAAHVQNHHREAGAVPSAPSHPSRASVLLMDEVTAAFLSKPFTFVPKVSQKCSNRKYFP